MAAVHGMAYKDETTTWLIEDILNQIGGDQAMKDESRVSTREILSRIHFEVRCYLQEGCVLAFAQDPK